MFSKGFQPQQWFAALTLDTSIWSPFGRPLQLAHTDVEVFEDDRHAGTPASLKSTRSCSPLDWPVMLTLAAVISLALVPLADQRADATWRRSRPRPRSC